MRHDLSRDKVRQYATNCATMRDKGGSQRAEQQSAPTAVDPTKSFGRPGLNNRSSGGRQLTLQRPRDLRNHASGRLYFNRDPVPI